MISFASDNTSGVHPKVLEALAKANTGTAPAYGDDQWTAEAIGALQTEFGPDSRAFFVFLGTGANVLGLSALLRPHHAVICAESAHINVDECGAPEAFLRAKLLTVPSYSGKIHLDDCRKWAVPCEAVHHSCPRVLSITQSTEFGTLYSVDELRAIGAFTREHGLYFHMDGARLANAAAALGVSLAAISRDVGVDVLSFGGGKNGLMFGEAVIFFRPELAEEFGFIRKQGMQLMSKMRFLSAQFTTYLQDGLWLKNACHANAMATLLAQGVAGLAHVRVTRPVEVNAVFARLPRERIAALHKEFHFYIWDEKDGEGCPENWPEVRWMTSFDSREEDVLRFVRAIQG